MKISACLITAGFIFASFFCMIMCKYNKETIKFIGSLNTTTQLEIYNKILAERTVIYLQGQILGVIVGLFYIYYFRQKGTYNYCVFALATFIITITYYLITPKQNYIIDHLTSQEQIVAWRESQAAMTNTYIFGFILGMVGYILLARILARVL